MNKKPLNKEQQTQAAILNGIIQGYGLNKVLDGGSRKWRRRRVKYFWFPLYAIGNPIITYYFFVSNHYVLGSLWCLYAFYGYGRMIKGDRFVLWLLSPITKRLMNKIFK